MKKIKYLILTFILFVLAPNVNALNVSYTNGNYDLAPMYCYSLTECFVGVDNSGHSWDDFPYNTIMDVSLGYDLYGNIFNSVRRIKLKQDVSLVANQSYTFTYNFIRTGASTTINFRGTTIQQAKYKTSSSSSLNNFSVNTISLSRSNTNQLILTFTPSFNASYVEFTLSLGVTTSSNAGNEIIANQIGYPTILFGVNSLSITTSATETGSTTGAINNQSTIIQNQTTIIDNSINGVNDSVKDTNDTIKNDNVDESESEYADFFSGFSTNTFGLTSIITAPLNLIGSITSSTCSPLSLQVPFLDNITMQLPCLSSIYQSKFGTFYNIYKTITFGIVAYWVCVKCFALVKDFKNPDHDEVEVMDL